MFASIIHRPRQLLLAAFMAIVLSAGALGALGAPGGAQAHTPSGTGFCGTEDFSFYTWFGESNPTKEHIGQGHWYFANIHVFSDGFFEYHAECDHDDIWP